MEFWCCVCPLHQVRPSTREVKEACEYASQTLKTCFVSRRRVLASSLKLLGSVRGKSAASGEPIVGRNTDPERSFAPWLLLSRSSLEWGWGAQIWAPFLGVSSDPLSLLCLSLSLSLFLSFSPSLLLCLFVFVFFFSLSLSLSIILRNCNYDTGIPERDTAHREKLPCASGPLGPLPHPRCASRGSRSPKMFVRCKYSGRHREGEAERPVLFSQVPLKVSWFPFVCWLTAGSLDGERQMEKPERLEPCRRDASWYVME